MYLIESVGPSRYSSTLIPRYPLTFYGPKLYLPNQSAGAPSFSPAYDSFWTNTTNAVRVVGRLAKKYGTAFEDVTVAANAAEQGTTILLRQFVIPLNKTAYLSLGAWDSGTNPYVVAGYGPVLNFGTYARWTGTLRGANIWGVLRLVDSTGALVANTAERTVVVTIPGASGTNMTSAGLFLPSDAGCYFAVDAKGNTLQDGVNSSTLSTIATYNNASSVTIAVPFFVGDTSIGAGRTIRIYKATTGTRTAQEITGQVTSTVLASYTGGQYATIQLANKGWSRYYFVLEVGFIPGGNSGTGRSFVVRFGDPIDDTVLEDPVNGSVGGSLSYSLPSWLICKT